MAKRKERRGLPAESEETFKCPNSTCGLVFSKPIRVKNLREDSQVNSACPRCFTQLTEQGDLPAIEATPSPVAGMQTEASPEVGRKKEEPAISTRCLHRFGYLSERSKNEGIPDECVMCENIVKCMLKAVTG